MELDEKVGRPTGERLLNDQGNIEYRVGGQPMLYVPRNDTELSVIDILLDKDYRGITHKEKAKVVGICWEHFYRIKARQEVKAVMSYLILDDFKDKQAELLARSFKFGMENRRNFADRKLCAEIMGMKKDTKEVNINKKTMNVNMEVGSTTTAELESMVKQMIKKDPSCLPKDMIREMVRNDPSLIPIEIEATEVTDE